MCKTENYRQRHGLKPGLCRVVRRVCMRSERTHSYTLTYTHSTKHGKRKGMIKNGKSGDVDGLGWLKSTADCEQLRTSQLNEQREHMHTLRTYTKIRTLFFSYRQFHTVYDVCVSDTQSRMEIAHIYNTCERKRERDHSVRARKNYA